MARWRRGDCPVHGTGLVDDVAAATAAPPAENDGFPVMCTHLECDVRAWRWPGKDDSHALYGWRSGPEPIRAILAKAGDIENGGSRPGHHARSIRTTWLHPDVDDNDYRRR